VKQAGQTWIAPGHVKKTAQNFGRKSHAVHDVVRKWLEEKAFGSGDLGAGVTDESLKRFASGFARLVEETIPF
jgi:hypothetical protein